MVLVAVNRSSMLMCSSAPCAQPTSPAFRPACPADAAAVADLHADSWRRHYRGAYSDAFLDGDVIADCMATWTDRLREPDPRRCTILAEDGGLVVAFANMVFDDDPTWGALLDNLHVADRHKRRGIGSRLLALTAKAVIKRPERTGLYLWVLEQNVDAQAFYLACGGRCVGRRLVSSPGRNPQCCSGASRACAHIGIRQGRCCPDRPGDDPALSPRGAGFRKVARAATAGRLLLC